MTRPDLMDEARAIRQSVNWGSNESVEAIASAIAAAEQRGREEERERCAKIAEVMLRFADTTSNADEEIIAAIRRGTP